LLASDSLLLFPDLPVHLFLIICLLSRSFLTTVFTSHGHRLPPALTILVNRKSFWANNTAFIGGILVPAGNSVALLGDFELEINAFNVTINCDKITWPD
jgi:hypothetical protein